MNLDSKYMVHSIFLLFSLFAFIKKNEEKELENEFFKNLYTKKDPTH